MINLYILMQKKKPFEFCVYHLNIYRFAENNYADTKLHP